MRSDPERFDRGLWMSAGLHGLLAAFVLVSPALFPAYGDINWGSERGGAGGMNVEIVSNLSGVPLPAPAVVTEDAVANESPGFYESEEAPATPPEEVAVPDAEAVPEAVAPLEPPSPDPSPQPSPERVEEEPPAPRPDNAVPFGQGGQPAIGAGQFPLGDGVGAIAVGDGAFGERYGRYVESITRRISENWLRSMVASEVRVAPRMYVRFNILRDGTIVDVAIDRTSGVESLDRSAVRAIYASNPLAPLPADFRGSSVSVMFWFEYNR